MERDVARRGSAETYVEFVQGSEGCAECLYSYHCEVRVVIICVGWERGVSVLTDTSDCTV